METRQQIFLPVESKLPVGSLGTNFCKNKSLFRYVSKDAHLPVSKNQNSGKN